MATPVWMNRSSGVSRDLPNCSSSQIMPCAPIAGQKAKHELLCSDSLFTDSSMLLLSALILCRPAVGFDQFGHLHLH